MMTYDPTQYEAILQKAGYCIVDVDANNPLTASNISLKYTIVVLCLSGSVNYEMNMESFRMNQGMVVCYPHILLNRVTERSDDFKARAVIINDALALDCLAGIETSTLQNIFNQPSSRVDDENEWQLLLSASETLRHQSHLLMARDSLTSMTRPLVNAMLRSFMLLLCDHYLRLTPDSDSLAAYTLADAYFRRFITLIDQHVTQQHEVSFYAEKLHITPKYLTFICNNKTRHNAKDIISTILLQRIKSEIMVSGMSIKEIAIAYGFADQSSFGKFFRKMTGMSPLAYKNNLNTIQ